MIRLAVLLLVAACGSPAPATDAPRTRTPEREVDAAPPPLPFMKESGCLPQSASDPASADAGPELPPKIVSGQVLEPLRITGRRLIEPTAQQRRAMWRRHPRGIIVAKYCIDPTGHVVSVRLLKESGFAPYDDQVVRELSCWTFRPLVIDGVATPACSSFTLAYRLSPPSFAPAAP